MMPGNTPSSQLQARQKENYTINDLADEIRADQLCTTLLKQFHHNLLEERHVEPLEAGTLASGADYFLRDFMIGQQRANIFSGTAAAIRRFGGHWYIVSNLEPNLPELAKLLQGAAAFYQYCADQGLIEPERATAIAAACNDLDYYQRRIESFLDISGDGFSAWKKDAPTN